MDNGKSKTPAVLISGGSEIISLALAETLAPYDIPLVVISLGKPSLIRDVPQVMIHRQISWPPVSVDVAITEIINILEEIEAERPLPWPAFATEDGSLRLLLEGKDALKPYLNMSEGSPQLKMGGLDKAELFEYLQKQELTDYITPTIILNSPEEALPGIEKLGGTGVIKPAIKPLSMDLGIIGAKAIAVTSPADKETLVSRLSAAWSISERWVAQPLLKPALKGEALWWGVRDRNGDIHGLTAYERWKHPRMGGSACWVETESIPELNEIALSILTALKFQGITELPFLQDDAGHFRLIELNPRSWLQVALPTQANLPLAYLLYLDLIHAERPEVPQGENGKMWVNIERFIPAALSGEHGSRFKSLIFVLKIIWRSDYKVVYSTPFSGIRLKWIKRMMEKVLKI